MKLPVKADISVWRMEMQVQESDGPVWEKPGLAEGSFQIAAAFDSPAPVVTVALAAWGNSCVLREGILMLAPGHKVPLASPVLEGREELGPYAPQMRPAPIVHDPQMQHKFNTQHHRIPKDAEGNLLRSGTGKTAGESTASLHRITRSNPQQINKPRSCWNMLQPEDEVPVTTPQERAFAMKMERET